MNQDISEWRLPTIHRWKTYRLSVVVTSTLEEEENQVKLSLQGGAMSIKPIDWTGAWTLEDYLRDLIQAKKMGTQEFKTMVNIFGAQRIELILKRWKEETNQTSPDQQKPG